MVSYPKSGRVLISDLLLSLYHDETTGVITLQDERRAIKIYLKSGHVVYADGVDTDSQLLREIATKKGLDEKQLNELKDLKEKYPQSLGQTLIDRKFLSQAGWNKFLELKVKHIIGVALQMDTPDLGFRESELNIPSINFIDYNMVQLLLDAIRGIRRPEHFKKYIPGDNVIFMPAEKAKELKGNIPLSPSEESIFSMINGQNTVSSIIKDTGMEGESIYRTLYLLLCFNLITAVPEGGTQKQAGVDYSEVIDIYSDLLRTIDTNFRREVGDEFEGIFNACKEELTGQTKDLLRSFNLSSPNPELIVEEISRRFSRRGKPTEGKLFLLSSFNKLMYLLLVRMKSVLGLRLAERTLNEMMKMLEYLGRYKRDAEMIDYFRKNLEDYLGQMQT